MGEEKRAALRAALVDASVADGAGNDTHTAVKHWVRYCIYCRNISPERRAGGGVSSEDDLVIETNLLSDYLTWLVLHKPLGNHISVDSALGYVGTVRAWHLRRFRRTICGGLDSSLLADTAKGLRRRVAAPTKRKRFGCRTQDLAEACARNLSPSQGDSEAVRADKLNWRAALAAGFCALMRAGEFAIDKKVEWDAIVHLSRADVSFFYDEEGVLCVAIMMRPLKTGKPVRGKTCRVVLRSGGSLLDPVRALEELLRLDPATPGRESETPLFRSRSSSASRSCITVSQVRDMVRLLMRSVGADPKLFGAHSLRIGGASAALAAGIHPSTIRVMGRWASDIYEVYMRMSFQASVMATQLIASTSFTDIERAFHSEELELLPSELGARVSSEDEA